MGHYDVPNDNILHIVDRIFTYDMLVTEPGCWSPVVIFKIPRQHLKSVTNINALQHP